MSDNNAIIPWTDPATNLATKVWERRESRLPTIKGEFIASLTTCSTNLNASCDFHTRQKFERYKKDWKHPAPSHCQLVGGWRKKRAAPEAPEPVYMDRLGVNMDPVCDALR